MDNDETKPGVPSDPPPAGENLIAAARAQAEAARKAIEAAEAAAPAPPAQIAGYEILGEIHRGGQGVVYKAIQQNTRRKVAIKVMLQGAFSGARDHARFEREVQILAQIRDPGVVAIHDSGQADGHFYYVMDYISGLALDEHLAQRELSMRETLGLFVRICQGVNAAHLRGIIHRDLKPSNIRIDADGDPHILDFGLAKIAMGDMFGAKPQVMTMTGQFVGSLPWASPEQAEGVSDRIDVRTDVYSLGVILYQMLTGDFPYEVRGSMREVLDHIVRSHPGRPSTKAKGVRDEVDTITLKALEKDRERRYQTAGELGRDVERYLRGEMIEAKRDSATYMLRKALGRNKGLVGVVSAFVVLVATFGVVSSILWGLAEDRRRAAEAAEQNADAALTLAERRITTFREVIAGANPESGGGASVTVREVADKLADDAESLFAGDPRGRALLRLDIAEMYHALGLRNPAIEQARLAVDELSGLVGDADRDTIRAMSALSNMLRWPAGADSPEARAQTLEAQRLCDRVLTAYESAPLGSDRRRAQYAGALSNLARQREQADEHEGAEEMYAKAISVMDALPDYRDSKDRMKIEANRAQNLMTLGRADEGERILRQLCERARSAPEVEPIELGTFLQRHANVLWAVGRRDEAIERRKEAIDLYREAQGAGGRQAAILTWTLVEWLQDDGRTARAQAVAAELVDELTRAFPLGHDLAVRGAFYRGRLGEFYLASGDPERGERELRRACMDLVVVKDGDGSVGRFARALTEHLEEADRHEEAEGFLAEIAAARSARDAGQEP